MNSPYAMLWNEDWYYLLEYSDKREKVVSFRIDHMCVPKLIEEPIVPMSEDVLYMKYKTFMIGIKLAE